MRKREEILNDIRYHEDAIAKCEKELNKIKDACPHPEAFLVTSTSDIEDECGGPGIYEYSVMKVECQLCDKKAYERYDKNDRKKVKSIFREYQPNPCEVIQNG